MLFPTVTVEREEVAALEVIQGVLASQTLHTEKAELARSFPCCSAPRSVPLGLERTLISGWHRNKRPRKSQTKYGCSRHDERVSNK